MAAEEAVEEVVAEEAVAEEAVAEPPPQEEEPTQIRSYWEENLSTSKGIDEMLIDSLQISSPIWI